MPVVNRYYSSNAVRTTTTTSISSTDLTVPVSAVTGFPASTPFTLVLDEGQVSEEIVTVTTVSALTLTILRGVDGTTAVAHSLGAKAVHALTARDLREPQEHIAAEANVHGFVGNLTLLATRSQTGLRNRVINGDFRVNQRGYVSGAALAVGVYGFDRWKSTDATTTLTFTAYPNGAWVTISAGGSIAQVIERANMPGGAYLVSWGGDALGRIYNSGGTASYVASPIATTLDGLADVVVEFATIGVPVTLTNVQVEAGGAAYVTPFERRPIGMELALCQQYYRPMPSVGAAVAVTPVLPIGTVATSTIIAVPVVFTPPMRAVPTVTFSGCTGNDGTSVVAVSGVAISGGTTASAQIDVTCASAAFTVGRAARVYSTGAGGFIALNAEL